MREFAANVHFLQFAAPLADELHHAAELFRWHLDDQRLKWLMGDTIDFFDNHLRLTDRQLVPLTPHVLDEDGKVQYAAAGNGEGVAALDLAHTKGDVTF